MNLLEKLASEGKLTPEQVERIGRNVAEFKKAAEEDPKFRAEAKEKLAGFFDHINWKATAGTMAAAAGIQAGSNVINDVYQNVKGSVAKARNYKDMINANPELSRMNSREVQRHFSTLHKFNPDYASDPNVAGQYIQDSIQMERTPLEQVNALVKSRSDMAKARQSEQQGGMFDTSAMPAGLIQTKPDASDQMRTTPLAQASQQSMQYRDLLKSRQDIQSMRRQAAGPQQMNLPYGP